MRKASLLLIFTLVGCGSVSQVVPIDSDTYMVASHGVLGNGSAAEEKVRAVRAAAAYCESKGRTVQVVGIESVDPFFGRAPSAEVRFRCVVK